MLSHFLVVAKGIKAVLHDVTLIGSHKLDCRHVDKHQMSVVTDMSTPGFDSVSKLTMSHGPLDMHRKLQLMERLTEQEALSSINVLHSHSDCLFKILAVTDPVREGASDTLLVNLANGLPQSIHTLINRQLSFFPNGNGSLFLELRVTNKNSPQPVTSGRLELNSVLVTLDVLAPGVESLCLQSVAFAHQSNVLILANLSKRLQAGIVPSVDSTAKFMETKTVGDFCEGLQLVVAVTVELGVLAQLLVCSVDTSV